VAGTSAVPVFVSANASADRSTVIPDAVTRTDSADGRRQNVV
jgi:hypothetical protein